MIRPAAASVPLALVLLQVTAVAVLVPDIRLDLGSSSSGGQWVLNAYLLALAALYPLCALVRGRELTIAGALAMAAGALVCARADSTAVLVAGQALQGAGAATLVRPAAGSWAALALPAAALAIGPLLGGVFAEQNWWRVFFWAGVPLASLAGLAALAAPHPPERRDPADLAAYAVGLTALTIALVQSEVWPWGWAVALGLVGAALLARAGAREVGARPALAVAPLAGCLTALLFLMPEYFQLARNLSGSRSGALLLALTLPAVAAWALSKWRPRIPPAAARAIAGVGCVGVGLAILATVDTNTRYFLLIGALGLAGTGLGLTAATLRGSLEAALAGATLGLATAGAAFQIAQANERESGATFEEALAAGVGWAALALALAVAGALILRARRASTPASSGARPAAGS